jgi:hypothetical protein
VESKSETAARAARGTLPAITEVVEPASVVRIEDVEDEGP